MDRSSSIILISWVALLAHVIGQNPKEGEEYKIYRVIVASAEDEEILETLRGGEMELQFLAESLDQGFVDIMLKSNAVERFEHKLKDYKMQYQVLTHNVNRIIQEELDQRQINNTSSRRKRAAEDFDVEQFHSYETIVEYLIGLMERYPSFVRVFSIGNTTEGQPIYTAAIGTNSSKSVWIDGGIRSREWLSITTAVYFINNLVQSRGSDAQIDRYLHNITFFITPVLNPDGYQMSRQRFQGDNLTSLCEMPMARLWGRNLRPRNPSCNCTGVDELACIGVELNRNFGYNWQDGKPWWCQAERNGPSAFSEPESRAVRDFVLSHSPQLKAYISLRAYGNLWLYPYTYAKGQYPADVEDLKLVAQKGAKMLSSLYNTTYQVGSAADYNKSSSGSPIDWAKSVGVKYAYYLFLREGKKNNTPMTFISGRDQIVPTATETWYGLQAVFDAIANDSS